MQGDIVMSRSFARIHARLACSLVYPNEARQGISIGLDLSEPQDSSWSFFGGGKLKIFELFLWVGGGKKLLLICYPPYSCQLLNLNSPYYSSSFKYCVISASIRRALMFFFI